MTATRERSRLRSEAGLSLIELMIALVIASVAIAAALAMAYSMMNGYRGQQRALRVEQAARASLDILAGALRNASPGARSGRIFDVADCPGPGFPDQAIEVRNSFDAEETDALRVVYASGGVFSELYAPYGCSASGGECDGQMRIADLTGFSAGDYVVVVDGTFDSGVLLEVDQPHGDHLDIVRNDACELGAAGLDFAPGSLAIRARTALFYVDHDTFGVPMLMVDPDDAEGPAEPEPVAEGIEDLQVAVGIDLDGDGTLEEIGAAANDDEWFYNVAGDSAPPLASVQPWRALRITLAARSTRETSTQAGSYRPPAEDRDGSTTADPHKRRSLTTIVELRNLRGSL